MVASFGSSGSGRSFVTPFEGPLEASASPPWPMLLRLYPAPSPIAQHSAPRMGAAERPCEYTRAGQLASPLALANNGRPCRDETQTAS